MIFVLNTRDKLLARISDAAAHIKEATINSDEQHATFAKALQNASRMKMDISKTCGKILVSVSLYLLYNIQHADDETLNVR
jgi:hypothetical protein